MKKINKDYTKLPESISDWLQEIAAAYKDAHDAIPFGVFTGQKITEAELFHLTPAVCLKFRGIKNTKALHKKVTEAMLSSYVATKDTTEGIFNNPHVAFAFCYLASHFGLELLTEDEFTEIMEYIEAHQQEILGAIEKQIMEIS